MAGATISGRRQASAAAVSRLSAWPSASLAIVFAEAGAIRNASARSTSSRWRERRVRGRGIAREGAAQRVAAPTR